MVGAAVIFLQTSCALPQAIILWRGRERVLPERPFSLGRYGTFVNAVSVAWVVFLDIISFLPAEMPVTKENMNYVSVVSVGLTGIVLALYFFTKRGKYLGPRVFNDPAEERMGTPKIQGKELDDVWEAQGEKEKI